MWKPKTTNEEVSVEVYEVIESSLAKFKEWLEVRLRKQDELLLRSLSTAHSLGGVAGLSVKGDLPPVKEFRSVDDLHSMNSEKRLRFAAGQTSETLTSEMSMDEIPLPGSVHQSEAQPPPSALLQDSASPQSTPDIEPTARDSAQDRSSTMTTQNDRLDTDWQTKLMDVFDQLDLDRSGSIDRAEFTEAFEELGMNSVRGLAVFDTFDKSENKVIDRVEWLQLVESAARGNDDEVNLLLTFLDELAQRQQTKGKIYDTDRTKRPCCILRHDSAVRMVWDLMMMSLLFYVAIFMPYTLSFDDKSKTLKTIDLVVDLLFCSDVLLNFRTSYVDQDESIIVDGKRIAINYLRSWFTLDFVSSFPFDVVTAGLLPNMTPARLLKMGKIAKVSKLLRLRVLAKSELLERLEENSTNRTLHTFLQLLKLIVMAFLSANWLACLGAFIDSSSLDAYFADESPPASDFQKYLAAMYWAMTTLSTVGYGDITPKTDAERVYAMVAMIIGGALYGYVIGSVTQIVTEKDVNTRTYNERFEIIQAWLYRHEELPDVLRRRLRKYFKQALKAKLAMDDSEIVHELPPDLSAETSFFLINEHVQQHPMFTLLPQSDFANLVGILEKKHLPPSEFIVKSKAPGKGMHILVDGVARYDKGMPWQPRNSEVQGQRFQLVVAGGSFGEEILFGLEKNYLYSIVTISTCEFHTINLKRFQERFLSTELHDIMLAGFLKSRGVQG